MEGSSGSQRADVADKYSVLYHLLAQVIRLTLTTTIENKFDFLLDMVPGVWASFAAGKIERENLFFETLHAAAERVNTEPRTWREYGVDRAGTNRDYNHAEWAVSRDILLRHAREDCDLILDLGCGWGGRLFQFWRAHGPRRAVYAGGDRPPGSQACVNALSGLFPDARAMAFPFDFLNPDFGAVSRLPATQILVFTYHAIEQVEHLGPQLFDSLLSAFPTAHITGVHLEPVSFQIPGWDTESPDSFRRDRDYAVEKRYNTDLYNQIVRRPDIRLIDAQPAILDTLGGNSRALLVWETLPR